MLIDSIQKDSRGKIFVDDLSNPTTAFIKTNFDSYVYFGGDEKNRAFIDEVKDYLLNIVKPKIIIAFSTTDEWKEIIDDLFKEYNPFRVTRHLFKLNHSKNKEFIKEKRLSGDFKIESIELENSFEFIIKKGTEEVSKCCSVYIGDGKVEISIETDERYRRQGFASIVSNVFIEYCLGKGLEPNWSCWDYNKPSFELALKLGFENHMNLQVHIVKLTQ
jgi:RimJ/RimL family protein N-acetyltransferase